MFFQDLRYGARSLIRTRAFTATALAVLALAIGANTALFSVVEALLVRPLPYRDYQRLAVLWKTVPSKHIEWDWASGPIVQDWRERNHAFEDLAIFLRPEASLVTYSTKSGPEKIQATKTWETFSDCWASSRSSAAPFQRTKPRKEIHWPSLAMDFGRADSERTGVSSARLSRWTVPASRSSGSCRQTSSFRTKRRQSGSHWRAIHDGSCGSRRGSGSPTLSELWYGSNPASLWPMHGWT